MSPSEALVAAVFYLHTLTHGGQSHGLLPVRAGLISSEYGVRVDPFHGEQRVHQGVDIAAPAGSAVRAVAQGQVIFSGYHHGYGNVVGVKHDGEITTLYAHCWAVRVSVGDVIAEGTVVGYVGDSGRATGPHLHFEVRVAGQSVDPLVAIGVRQKIMQHR